MPTNRLDSVLMIEAGDMAVTTKSIRVDARLADKAVKLLGAKSRTEAVHIALREIVALRLRRVKKRTRS